MLLDGEPLNQAFAGLVNWNSLNPLDVARIEVARGPFSSLYGGNAMGGVINIITKTPQEREVTIQSGYGSDNTWNEYASYGDKLYNRLSIFASFGYKQSDGYPTSCLVHRYTRRERLQGHRFTGPFRRRTPTVTLHISSATRETTTGGRNPEALSSCTT